MLAFMLSIQSERYRLWGALRKVKKYKDVQNLRQKRHEQSCDTVYFINFEAVIRKISELEESLRQTTEAMLTMRTQAEDTPHENRKAISVFHHFTDHQKNANHTKSFFPKGNSDSRFLEEHKLET